MVEVQQLLPDRSLVDPLTLTDRLRTGGKDLVPFDERVVSFVADLSRHLRRDESCRRIPAISALAFWIRSANVERLRQEYQTLQERSAEITFAPRGLVFHMPPTNVDTLFVYSWLMSALVGNANVVRISSNASGDTPLVLKAIGTVLADHPEVSRTMAFVEYGHESEITAALSTADVRVIWGGDETVRSVRSVPMNPLGSELAFADRFSLAVLNASSVDELDQEGLVELARQFYNDSYWFDQLGCSSPRVVYWQGDDSICSAAEKRFVAALRERVDQERYQTPVGAVMNKLVRSATIAADGYSNEILWNHPEVTIVAQLRDSPVVRDAPGGGMFAFHRIANLSEIVEKTERRDQTLSYFGFDRVALTALAHELNGRGIDRIVPVGSALQFDRFWDGWDLLESFSRRTAIVF